MKGLVKYALGPEGLALRELPEPSPRAGELKVKVLAAGICASDIHAMRDERGCVMPVVLGHEYVGQVVELGEDVTDFAVGDWVTTLPACYSCGTCEFCLAGEVTLCKHRASIGTHFDGAMADYVRVPAKYSFHVPAEAENKLAYAALEPLCCAARGIYEQIDIAPGDVVVLSGPGVIGLFALQLLKARGARVIVSGLPQDRARLDRALELGADKTVESFSALQEVLAAMAPGGADVVVEAAGVAPSLNNCLKVVKTHGKVLQLGFFGHRIECDIDAIFIKELTFTASNSSAMSSWDLSLRLLAEGKVKLEPVIGAQYPLSEWKRGFDAVIEKGSFKVLLIP